MRMDVPKCGTYINSFTVVLYFEVFKFDLKLLKTILMLIKTGN